MSYSIKKKLICKAGEIHAFVILKMGELCCEMGGRACSLLLLVQIHAFFVTIVLEKFPPFGTHLYLRNFDVTNPVAIDFLTKFFYYY